MKLILILLLLLFTFNSFSEEFSPDCLETYRKEVSSMMIKSKVAFAVTTGSATVVLGTYFLSKPSKFGDNVIYTFSGIAAISGITRIAIEQKKINRVMAFFLILDSIPELYFELWHQPLIDFTTDKFFREREAVKELLIQGIIKKFNKKQSRLEEQILANNDDFKIAVRNLYRLGKLCRNKKNSNQLKTIKRNKFEKYIRQELNEILNK